MIENFVQFLGWKIFGKYRWKNFENEKNFWVGKKIQKLEKFLGEILDFSGDEKFWKIWVFFGGLGIEKFLGLLWVCYWGVGAGLAGLRIFIFLVFFGVLGFLVVFDIYVWRYKFFLLWVYVELLERRLIILVFLVLSCWIIGRKCKNFDGNFGPVWSFSEIFAISLKNVLKKIFFLLEFVEKFSYENFEILSWF